MDLGGNLRDQPAADTETVETDLGPVECARAGEGPPVLFVHGTPGGSDSSLAMGQFLVKAGFELIAPSRPGYLETPLESGKTIDQQADLHAALLDSLGYRSAGVVAWSGGGPSSYRLAVKHPQRVNSLVPFACVSGKIEEPADDLETRLMLKTSAGNWMLRFMATHMAKDTVAATLKAEGDLTKDQLKQLTAETMDDPSQLEVVITMAEVVGDYKHREAGVTNDWAQFAAIDTLELERITAPTLVINGTADVDVPPAHSDHAAATIPGAERIEMPQGTHLSLFAHEDAPKTQDAVAHWLGKPR